MLPQVKIYITMYRDLTNQKSFASFSAYFSNQFSFPLDDSALRLITKLNNFYRI